MPNEPVWVTPDDVVAINREVLAGTGEPHLLRDRGLLEGACQRPWNHWAYGGARDVVSLAAVLILGIANDHPFAQGNKRTAFAAAAFFLEDNGFRLVVDDDTAFADALIAAIAGEIEEAEMAEILRRAVAGAG